MSRIAMLTDYPLVDLELANGGVVNASFNLVRELAASDELELIVFVPRQDISRRSEVFLGRAKLVFFRYSKIWKYLDHFLEYRVLQNIVRRLVLEFKPDILHTVGNFEYILCGVRHGIKHVATVHGLFFNELKYEQGTFSLKHFIKLRSGVNAERTYLPLLENAIATTTETERAIRTNNRNAKIAMIDNALSQAYFDLNGSESVSNTILFVAAVRFRKGLHNLLAALRQLRSEGVSCKLHVVGRTDWDETYVDELKTQFSDLLAEESVVFRGTLSSEELLQEFKHARLLCLPSLADSQPMVILQAMAASLPVVASSIGGIPDMISQEETGILVEPDNIGLLTQALRHLLADNELCRRIGTMAGERVKERYSPQVIARKTIDFYESL